MRKRSAFSKNPKLIKFVDEPIIAGNKRFDLKKEKK
jgi:hypothetical protein